MRIRVRKYTVKNINPLVKQSGQSEKGKHEAGIVDQSVPRVPKEKLPLESKRENEPLLSTQWRLFRLYVDRFQNLFFKISYHEIHYVKDTFQSFSLIKGDNPD